MANPAEIERSAEFEALQMVALIERAAEQGEWERAEKLTSQLRLAIVEIPGEQQRAEIAQAAHKVLERVQTVALTSRVEVLDKLSEIRRGRDAQRAYGQPAANNETASLR
ncbi:MAG: hypothetical protein AAFN50_12050 [Pseudomonadota bacterium]